MLQSTRLIKREAEAPGARVSALRCNFLAWLVGALLAAPSGVRRRRVFAYVHFPWANLFDTSDLHHIKSY
jgi:hypothetical protein